MEPFDNVEEEEPSLRTIRTDAGGSETFLGRIDQYGILRKLGSGGFGVVYLARDTNSGVDVAVKTLHPLLKYNAEEMDLLREKFRLVHSLTHPNIAKALVIHRVREINVWDAAARVEFKLSPGDSVMVMDYAPGVTLSKWRRQFPDGVVPPDLALEIGRQLASALDYAHGERIVHRDVKPGNIMVETLAAAPQGVEGLNVESQKSEDGTGPWTFDLEPSTRIRVRLLDFGLAAEIRSSMSRISIEQGDTSGTRPYMAPEQWLGKKQDGRTDQYALACVLYELFSGAPPFSGVFETGDPAIMERAVVGRDPEAVEGLSPAANAALLRGLSKDPKDRFPTCIDLLRALDGDTVSNEETECETAVLCISAIANGSAASGAKCSVWGQTFPLPARLRLDSGSTFGPINVIFEDAEGRCHSGSLEPILVDWKDEKSVVIHLKAVPEDTASSGISGASNSADALGVGTPPKATGRKRGRRWIFVIPTILLLLMFGVWFATEHRSQKVDDSVIAYEVDDSVIAYEYDVGFAAMSDFRYEEAIRHFETVLPMLSPDSVDADGNRYDDIVTEALAECHYRFARCLKSQREFAKAHEHAVAAARLSYPRAAGLASRLENPAKMDERLQSIILPPIDFREANIEEVIDFFNEAVRRRAEATNGNPIWFEYPIDLLSPHEMKNGRRMDGMVEHITPPFTCKSDDSLSLKEVLDLYVDCTGLQYRFDGTAVKFSPKGAIDSSPIRYRKFTVPDDFELRVDSAVSMFAKNGVNGAESLFSASGERDWQATFRFLGGNVDSSTRSFIRYDLSDNSIYAANTEDGIDEIEDVLSFLNKVTPLPPRPTTTMTTRLVVPPPRPTTTTMTRLVAPSPRPTTTTTTRHVAPPPRPTTTTTTRHVASTTRDVLLAGERKVVSVGSVRLALRWCPATTSDEWKSISGGNDFFLMGSPASEEGRYDDETQHPVKLTKGFWMGETEVTQRLWKEVMGGNNRSRFNPGDEYPVENISWKDCQEFLKALNRKSPLTGFEWRLPTEAQWEYACRAGTRGPHAGTGRLDDMGWYSGNDGKKTHRVGTKTGNAWGLFDMHGNVWEWCADGYDRYPLVTVTDPLGRSRGWYRVFRGGSWGCGVRDCRSANRGNGDPGGRSNSWGFRVALVPVQ